MPVSQGSSNEGTCFINLHVINGESRTDVDDLNTFTSAWLSTDVDANWNSECDLSDPIDSVVDLKDFAIFASRWLENNQ